MLVLVFCCFCYSNSFADTTTTNPTELDLSDGTITNPYGGCPSGTTAAQVNTSNWGTETVRFGECVNTFAISMAINQALSQSGISVDKVHYRWKYIMCFNTPSNDGNHFCSNSISNRVNTTTGEVTDDRYFDQLAVTVEVTDAAGNVVKTETWTMDKWYDWNNTNAHSTNEINENGIRWQIHEDNIELYNHLDKIGTIYTPNQLGDVRFRVVGNDGGNWDGYYGPVVRDIESWFTYRTNPCNDTALYDPSCPGYSEAYAQYEYDQNCAANALYDSGCPGYAQAFYNAQCAANPLYDSGCAGYATAYYNQQCSLDALYDEGCPGYAEAYLTQQCDLDPLYDSSCDGYAEAYLTQQCTLNPLYDSSCDGYAAAYLAQQCALDATYDSSCDGFLEAKCEANALYSVQCSGYAEAYFNQQCLLNPQYDPDCNGYIAPVTPSDPGTVDDGTGTGDAVVDDILETPDLPIIVIPTAPEPEPEIELPEIEIDTGVGTNNTNTTPEIEIPDIDIDIPEVNIESIEAEVENEIEQELEIEPEIETEPETNNNEPTTEENTTEETTEENTVEEETVEEETVEEETTEEESTEEESTEEESTEEESTEEESTDEADEKEESEESEEKESEEKEESENEEVVAKKDTKNKKVKKLSAKEKAAAKKKKMKEIIKEKLKQLAVLMGEAESLKEQAALQQLIAALINYVPGFNEYGKYNIPGINFYQPEAIYEDKKIPENQRGLLNGLASELKHKKMVDMQYEGME